MHAPSFSFGPCGPFGAWCALALSLGLGTATSGCLEVRTGYHGTTEASDTTTTDTTTTDTADTGDTGCGGQSCDDGDPCTEDQCNPTTGACEHHPSTHDPIPGCQGLCPNNCDDGDPCTDDGCAPGGCQHDALPACNAQCTSQDLLSVNAAINQPWGAFLKVRGTVQMSRDQLICTDDNGMCNCTGIPALVAESELQLFTSLQDEPTMTCRSHDGAPQTIGCEPVQAGVAYRVWGTGGAFNGSATPAANGGAERPKVPAPAPIQAIDVAGYCLETAGISLIGKYQLLIGFNGSIAKLDAEIWIDEPGWLFLSIKGALCNSCGTIDSYSVLEVLDNGLRFRFDAPTFGWTGAAVARLVSNGNSLTGNWIPMSSASRPRFTLHGPAASVPPAPLFGAGEPAGSATDPAGGVTDPFYSGGTIELVRLPAEAPRDPCALP